MAGLTPCYDLVTWELAVPYPNGYRLPTEAEWERAAGWDGSKHWTYSFTDDTMTGFGRCNYSSDSAARANPLGFSEHDPWALFTSPTGWFDGMNVSPNGNVPTVDSPSPVGAYDMSGNVWEWCHDGYDGNYYDGGEMVDPIGPDSHHRRVARGGGWNTDAGHCRSAARWGADPWHMLNWIGFRVCRSPSP